MNTRPVDHTKKSNIKCEHCLFADKDKEFGYWCCLKEEKKNYWNRCKSFKWETENKSPMVGSDIVIHNSVDEKH